MGITPGKKCHSVAEPGSSLVTLVQHSKPGLEAGGEKSTVTVFRPPKASVVGRRRRTACCTISTPSSIGAIRYVAAASEETLEPALRGAKLQATRGALGRGGGVPALRRAAAY